MGILIELILLGLLNDEEDGKYAEAYNEVETYITETVRDGLPNDFLEEIGESEEEDEKVEEEGDGDVISTGASPGSDDNNASDGNNGDNGGDRGIGLSEEASDEEEEQTEALTKTYEATAYTSNCEGCSGITYSGYDVRNTIYSPEGMRIIATDPSVIPTGTVVEITLNDGSSFKAEALDIGGAIKGNRIDLLVDSYEEAMSFGRQDVEIHVID